MALPSSIWVKFKDDQIKVTYLGVEYTCTRSNRPPTILMDGFFACVSGDNSNGTFLKVVDADGEYLFNDPPGEGVNATVYTFSITDDVFNDDETQVGQFPCGIWSVEGTPTGSIAAATIIHRDPTVPKMYEVPFFSGTTFILDYTNEVGQAGAVIDIGETAELRVFFQDTEHIYSLTWDPNINVGTTDCPFVEWIGELATTETFTESGTWTPPANIDTTKPVIVECWGAGANGADGTTGAGGAGGGGGAYASADLSSTLLITLDAYWDVNVGSSYIPTELTASIENVSAPVSAVVGNEDDGIGGDSSQCTGDVTFSGGDGAAGDGSSGGAAGKAAKPYADGEDYTGPAGATASTLAANATEVGDGGGGGFGDGAYQAGGTGADGLVKIHYSLQISTNGDNEVEIVELNNVYDNIEVTFATRRSTA